MAGRTRTRSEPSAAAAADTARTPPPRRRATYCLLAVLVLSPVLAPGIPARAASHIAAPAGSASPCRTIGYGPGQTVTVTESGAVIAKIGSDAGSPTDRSLRGTVTIDCGGAAARISVTGTGTGDPSSIQVRKTGSHTGTGGGGLTDTQVVVIGFAAVGLVLLLGGALLTIVGRRRR